MTSVVVIPTGTANTASVMAAFRRLGTEPRLGGAPEEVARARRVVLPGVGSFASGADALDKLGIRDALIERLRGDLPTLAICVGFQLLGSASDESPGWRGLSVIDQGMQRIQSGVRVPHMGWAPIDAPPTARYVISGWGYFAHSYRLAAQPEGWTASWSDHGEPFVAALERGRSLACQFHPELSGSWGSGVLWRWLHDDGEDR